MNQSDLYLLQILKKYEPHDLSLYTYSIYDLKKELILWAGNCYLEIIDSGSRAKGTAISLASDVDYLVSLSNGCNQNSGGLRSIYSSLHSKLSSLYQNTRKQNVSVRINLNGLEVDITPAKKQLGNTNNHSLYVSKLDTWKQTNIQKHINDVSQSGRLNEIRLLKIWRELHGLEFPSIYLEYLVIDRILLGMSKDVNYLSKNFLHILTEFGKNIGNPIYYRIDDPASSTNVLSELLSNVDKGKIINQARISVQQPSWDKIVW